MLDVSTQAALLEAIAAVQDERELGVLLITHDRVLADAWCDEIVDIRELGGARAGACADVAAPAAAVPVTAARGRRAASATPSPRRAAVMSTALATHHWQIASMTNSSRYVR